MDPQTPQSPTSTPPPAGTPKPPAAAKRPKHPGIAWTDAVAAAQDWANRFSEETFIFPLGDDAYWYNTEPAIPAGRDGLPSTHEWLDAVARVEPKQGLPAGVVPHSDLPLAETSGPPTPAPIPPADAPTADVTQPVVAPIRVLEVLQLLESGGRINMGDVGTVIAGALLHGYAFESAWIREHPDLYARGLRDGFIAATDDPPPAAPAARPQEEEGTPDGRRPHPHGP